MSTPRAPDRFDDVPGDDLRAAEYVLGVTSADERRAAQSRIDTDAAFAGLVDAWEHRFSDWLLRRDSGHFTTGRVAAKNGPARRHNRSPASFISGRVASRK